MREKKLVDLLTHRYQNSRLIIGPSMKEKLLYGNTLSCFSRKDKVLLFGATPGLRQILSKNNMPTTIFDKNLLLIKAMDRLIGGRQSNEKIMLGDWNNGFPSEDETFNLVLGDCCINFVDFIKWDRFFENIKRILKSNGYFITKIANKSPNKISLKELIAEYKQNPFKFEDIAVRTFLYRTLSTSEPFYEYTAYKSKWNMIDQELYQNREKLRISIEEFIALRTGKSAEICIPPVDVIERTLKNHFTIEETLYDDSNNFHLLQKIYKLRF